MTTPTGMHRTTTGPITADQAARRSVRARAALGAGLLATALLAACASNGAQQTAAPAERPPTRKAANGEDVIQADPAALGRIVGDLAPKRATTTTAKPGDPGGGGDPSSTASTASTTATTAPPTVITQQPTTTPPPVTFTFQRTTTTQKRTPQPYTLPLSPNEQLLLNKLQQVTGRTLSLDAGLFSAAQNAAHNTNPQLPGGTGITYTSWKAGNIWTTGQSGQAILDAPESQKLLPGSGPWNYVGLGASESGGTIEFWYIIAVA